MKKENLNRIMSPEGCELRVNRSIQAEGAFAQVKQNMKFRRFLSRGKENVLSECIIVAIAHNISRLHNKIVKNKCGIYLHTLKKHSKFIIYNQILSEKMVFLYLIFVMHNFT